MEKPFTPKFKQLNYIKIFCLLKREEASVVYTLNEIHTFSFFNGFICILSRKSSFRDKNHPQALTGDSVCPTCSLDTVHQVVFHQKSHKIAIFPYYISPPVTKMRIQHCTQEEEYFWRVMAEYQHFSHKFLHLEAF